MEVHESEEKEKYHDKMAVACQKEGNIFEGAAGWNFQVQLVVVQHKVQQADTIVPSPPTAFVHSQKNHGYYEVLCKHATRQKYYQQAIAQYQVH